MATYQITWEALKSRKQKPTKKEIKTIRTSNELILQGRTGTSFSHSPS
jgi:hypothetical protein